jgi:hypothetical protein
MLRCSLITDSVPGPAALTLPDGSQNAALFADGTHPNLAGIEVEWNTVRPLL